MQLGPSGCWGPRGLGPTGWGPMAQLWCFFTPSDQVGQSQIAASTISCAVWCPNKAPMPPIENYFLGPDSMSGVKINLVSTMMWPTSFQHWKFEIKPSQKKWPEHQSHPGRVRQRFTAGWSSGPSEIIHLSMRHDVIGFATHPLWIGMGGLKNPNSTTEKVQQRSTHKFHHFSVWAKGPPINHGGPLFAGIQCCPLCGLRWQPSSFGILMRARVDLGENKVW